MLERNLKSIAGALLLAILVLPAAGAAEEATKPAAEKAATSAPETTAELIRIESRIRELNDELKEIRDETMGANPELPKRADALREQVLAAIRGDGVDIDAKLAKMDEMWQTMATSNDLTREQYDALGADYRELALEVNELQKKAMTSSELQARKKELENDISAAMAAGNERVGEIYAELDDLAESFGKIYRRTSYELAKKRSHSTEDS